MRPASVIYNARRYGKSQDSGCNIENDGARIHQASGEVIQMLYTGDVMEDGGGGEFSPDNRDVSYEEYEYQYSNGNDAGDNLTVCQGRRQDSQSGKPGADQEKNGISSYKIRQSIGDVHGRLDSFHIGGCQVGYVRDKRIEQYREPQEYVKGVGGEEFGDDHLSRFNRGCKQCFQSTRFFFFRKAAHGQQGEEEHEVKPENGAVDDVEEQGFFLRRVPEKLQGEGKGDPLHD